MQCCIFCKSETNKFTTREHILPESLGGGEWVILNKNLFCDVCQNVFGSTIEQQALNDYPFSLLRTFLCIPTKKGKAPWFKSWEGNICGGLKPGVFCNEPLPVFEASIVDGSKTQMRILAHPIKPEMICRFLLKMGIEVVANENANYAFHGKFDEARRYALTGRKIRDWWYLQRENISEASGYITKGVTQEEWAKNVKLEVAEIEGGQEIFHLKILYLDLLIPLTINVTPQLNELQEPEYRLFWV